MELPTSRPLEPVEVATIDSVLLRLKEHFHESADDFEYNLVGFAFYEGCGGSDHYGAILAEASPLALGKELVLRHGFTWAAVREGDEWHFAVTHPRLESPIDLTTLEDGRYDSDTYDEPPDPGEVTYQALDGILRKVGQSR